MRFFASRSRQPPLICEKVYRCHLLVLDHKSHFSLPLLILVTKITSTFFFLLAALVIKVLSSLTFTFQCLEDTSHGRAGKSLVLFFSHTPISLKLWVSVIAVVCLDLWFLQLACFLWMRMQTSAKQKANSVYKFII